MDVWKISIKNSSEYEYEIFKFQVWTIVTLWKRVVQ